MFEMQRNVFKMKYTAELNSKLPRNVAKYGIDIARQR